MACMGRLPLSRLHTLLQGKEFRDEIRHKILIKLAPPPVSEGVRGCGPPPVSEGVRGCGPPPVSEGGRGCGPPPVSEEVRGCGNKPVQQTLDQLECSVNCFVDTVKGRLPRLCIECLQCDSGTNGIVSVTSIYDIRRLINNLQAQKSSSSPICIINRRLVTVTRSMLCHVTAGKYSLVSICESMQCLYSLLCDWGLCLHKLELNVIILNYIKCVDRIKFECIFPLQLVGKRKSELMEKFLEIEKLKILKKAKDNSMKISPLKIAFEPKKGYLLPLHLRSPKSRIFSPKLSKSKCIQTDPISRSLPCSPIKSRDNPPKSRDNPLISRDNPLISRDNPPKSRDNPLISRDNPLISRDNPLISRDNPLISRDNPPKSRDNPLISRDNPLISRDNPLISRDNPPKSRDNPLISRDNPLISRDNPLISRDNPPKSRDNPLISEVNPCEVPLSHSTPIKPAVTSSRLDEYANKWGEQLFERILLQEFEL